MVNRDPRAAPRPTAGRAAHDTEAHAARGATTAAVSTQLTSPTDSSAADLSITQPPLSSTPPWQPRAGQEIAGRYELIHLLGRGGQGEVWTARDRVLGETVALKWLHDPRRLRSARARREIALLRMLRMPGVVRLLDEGVAHGCAFVVMEVAPGAPFPGPPAAGEDGPARWTDIAPATLSLLEILSRVHARGVVHRDLKPANVIVDAGGRALLLDFGVSQWNETDGRGAQGLAAGTPAYMAPEQLAGKAVDGRADLYAVGVMLFEALAGALPPREGSAAGAARSDMSAARVREQAPHVPAPVATVIARLLARDPGDRLRSADDALAALGDVPSRRPASRARPKRRTTSHTERSLRALFDGPDRIFHLREDVAQRLWERTLGVPEKVEAELDAWVRLGVARVTRTGYALEPSGLVRLRYLRSTASAPSADGPDKPLKAPTSEAHACLSLAIRPLLARTLAGAMGISEEAALARCAELVEAQVARRVGDRFEAILPASLDELDRTRETWHSALAEALEVGEDGRLYHLIMASELSAAAAEAIVLGRRLAVEGDLAGARAALGEGLSALRLDPISRSRLEGSLLAELTKVAFAEATPAAYDLTLYELSRARGCNDEVEALEALLRAAIQVPGAISAEELSRLPSFSDVELQRRRNHVRVLPHATRTHPDEMAAALEETRRWAEASGDRFARLCLAEGTAFLRYAEGDFEGAAAAHLTAAGLDPWATGRVAFLVNAASSLLEAFRHREAEKRARQARKLAAQHRHFYSEARAEWVVRAARYRAGERLRPDLELVRAVERVGVPGLHALVCLNEAAVALRREDAKTARDLSATAHRAWSELGRKWGALLAQSLAIRAGAATNKKEILGLSELAIGCPIPGIGLQVLGLLAPAEPEIGLLFADAIPALLAPIPSGHRGLRMDVLSADEAARAIVHCQESANGTDRAG